MVDPSRRPFSLSQLVLAIVMAAASAGSSGPTVPKELTMQTPPNQKDQGKASLPIAEMVGATNAPILLTETTSHVSIPLHAPTGPALLEADPLLRQVHVSIENITSNEEGPSYEVYLNVPVGDDPAKHPDLLIGTLAMFGLVEASRSGKQHPDNGLTYKLNATVVYLRLLASGDWDSSSLRLSFVPEPWPGSAKVQVGRVSIYLT